MLAIFALLAAAQPAYAMNWEGHDDWMIDAPPANALVDAMPEIRPLPPRDCLNGPVATVDNPYEQVILPRHLCPQPLPDNLPEN